jgi:hypothetical protein
MYFFIAAITLCGDFWGQKSLFGVKMSLFVDAVPFFASTVNFMYFHFRRTLQQ